MLALYPWFSMYTRKIGKAWSIWWCHWMQLHISMHAMSVVIASATWWTAWVSGWRYATMSQTASNYTTRSTRPSQFSRIRWKHGNAYELPHFKHLSDRPTYECDSLSTIISSVMLGHSADKWISLQIATTINKFTNVWCQEQSFACLLYRIWCRSNWYGSQVLYIIMLKVIWSSNL